jgi:hypothetical protein
MINQGFNRILGKVDPSKGKRWLETSFPYGPPRLYYVRGYVVLPLNQKSRL